MTTLQHLVVAASLAATPAAFAEESHQHQTSPKATSVGWQQQLKGQTIVEEAIEGRTARSAQIEAQHHRLMENLDAQMQREGRIRQTSGAFGNTSMMHQYMGQDGSSFLLMSDNKMEPVSATGGKCPEAAPAKHYDISMIGIEITLNRWQDFYPGYMYVLTQDVDKARAEEAKNKAAREKDGF
ncbi:MAG: hypothetical protein ACKO9T_00230, partial [Nitrospira sp.]